MELLERNSYLASLDDHFQQVESGKGKAIFLTGEAGIGKTSLVNHWVETKEKKALIYTGACDSLFTPRPLGPLYDIAGQINQHFAESLTHEKDRTLVFTSLINHLTQAEKPVIMVFEDIHWADEATLDLIKFLARRINRIRCLFIATYRDDEIQYRHPLVTLCGELPSEHFSKIQLSKFSRPLVDLLASRKGNLSGQQLFQLTDGNPFYVMEILSAGSTKIPERVKDSILARFYSSKEETRSLCELLSILPSGRIEPYIMDQIEQEFGNTLDQCIVAGVIISRPGYLSFKHELFRITIEELLSPTKRKVLHKKMAEIIQKGPANSNNLPQLVHHARYADDRELVSTLAPRAAREASLVGAHREAVKLYEAAIEYADSSHDVVTAELYDKYAYECYLTYQIADAIAAQEKALAIWHQQNKVLKEGDALRFLSRLWWYAGEQAKALTFAEQAIEVLEHRSGLLSKELAWAYSNLSQLGMLSEDERSALHWGNKAIALAMQLDAKEIVSNALNNVGTVLLRNASYEEEGEAKLNQSLMIALGNGYHEHAARAYINLAYTFLVTKKYEKSLNTIDIGIKYCEALDLDFLRYYMVSTKARVLFETGAWTEAENICRQLLPNAHHLLVKIVILGILARLEMRYGRFDQARVRIAEGKALAKNTREIQRIIPILTAELELCWLTGSSVPADEVKVVEDTYFQDTNSPWYYSDLRYWKKKCGLSPDTNTNIPTVSAYSPDLTGDWLAAAKAWRKVGCPYEEALALLEGSEVQQKEGLHLLEELGATAASTLYKSRLKMRGFKNIPRGPRESTLSNPAQLTERQIDILHLLRDGLQNKEIADKLFISPKTVDHHISALLSKLEVNSRTKAVLEAQKLGILK
jgi:DNA-binding CsgD family transcriptional regulator/tetratricopeptide (TPR) repeat protein